MITEKWIFSSKKSNSILDVFLKDLPKYLKISIYKKPPNNMNFISFYIKQPAAL